jgi:hypothetical protein
MGVASWRWVRPVLTTGQSSRALASRAARRVSSAGTSNSAIVIAADSWRAVGITSFDDWHLLTWSLGWTFMVPPVAARRALARWATTSFMLVFVEVPDPVW